LLCAFASKARGQIGINTTSPDPSSVLDITSQDRGLLIPRLRTDQRLNISNPQTGLMVFDYQEKLFYFWNGSKWEAINVWKYENSSAAGSETEVTLSINKKVGIGTTGSPSEKLEVNGNEKINGKLIATDTVKALAFSGNGTIPVGGIIMWSGTTAPPGWALCVGGTYKDLKGVTQQIPDLRGRFVVGYCPSASTVTTDPKYTASTNNAVSIAYNGIGKPEGEASHQLTVLEMPSHAHSGSTDPNTHFHILPAFRRGVFLSEDPNSADSGGAHRGVHGDEGAQRNTGDNTHSHAISSEGGNLAHENRPPYYVLAYIIRIK